MLIHRQEEEEDIWNRIILLFKPVEKEREWSI